MMQNDTLPNVISGGLAIPAKGSGGMIDPEAVSSQFELSEGMKAADFGAGSGYFTILMAKKVGESGLVSAVDVLEGALDTIRSKAKQEGLRNIDTIRSNLEVLGSSGLANESQDAVLAANILFQSDKKEGIFQEARRILKSGGRLIIVEWKKDKQGFGPPLERRMDETAMMHLASEQGFSFAQLINAGSFHYGLIFLKR